MSEETKIVPEREEQTNISKRRRLNEEETVCKDTSEINRTDDLTSNENNELKSSKKESIKTSKFFNMFNGLFKWILKENIKIPSKEITDSIDEIEFLNFHDVISKCFSPKIIFVTDESKGEAENIFREDKNEKAWVTRRRRDVGHEWLIVKLKYPSIIYGIEINFEHLSNDICPHLSIEAVDNSTIDKAIKEEEIEQNKIINVNDETQKKKKKSYNFLESYKIDKCISDLLETQNTPWTELLQADCVDFLKNVFKKNNYFFKINDLSLLKPWTHIRINLYPDGGIQRMHLYGEFVNPTLFKKTKNVTKTSTNIIGTSIPTSTSFSNIFLNKPENGCTLIYYQCNSIYKGHPKYLIDIHKVEGFCTDRLENRPPIILRTLINNSNDNISIFKFGCRCIVENIIIDVSNHKFESPEVVHIDLLDCPDIMYLDLFEQNKIFDEDERIGKRKIEWFKLPPCKLTTDEQKHFFNFNLLEHDFSIIERTATHFKVSLHPDGGVTQINIKGVPL